MTEKEFISGLLEVAKDEAPRLPFEKVMERFEASKPRTYAQYLKIFLSEILGSYLVALFGLLTVIIVFYQFSKSIAGSDRERVGGNQQTALIIDNKPKDEVAKKRVGNYFNDTIRYHAVVSNENELAPNMKTDHGENKVIEPLSSIAFQIIDTSLYDMKIPYLLLKEDTSVFKQVDEIEKGRSTRDRQSEFIIRIKNDDDPYHIDAFILEMAYHGVSAKVNLDYDYEKGVIYKMTLQLEHAEGLDWHVRTTGFRSLDFKIKMDENYKPHSIAYRYNNKNGFSQSFLFNREDKVNTRLLLGKK